jgi:hypothetical protein
VLLIDEVSMLDARTFDLLERVACAMRGYKHPATAAASCASAADTNTDTYTDTTFDADGGDTPASTGASAATVKESNTTGGRAHPKKHPHQHHHNQPQRRQQQQQQQLRAYTPFGGLQVVVSGDFFQLPPVRTTSSAPSSATTSKFFCFEADAWARCVPPSCCRQLRVVYRQQDRLVGWLVGRSVDWSTPPHPSIPFVRHNKQQPSNPTNPTDRHIATAAYARVS